MNHTIFVIPTLPGYALKSVRMKKMASSGCRRQRLHVSSKQQRSPQAETEWITWLSEVILFYIRGALAKLNSWCYKANARTGRKNNDFVLATSVGASSYHKNSYISNTLLFTV